MKRSDVINYLNYAGYHQNSEEFIRLYAENKISYSAASEAYKQGYRKKLNGVGCTCSKCKQIN